MFGAYSVKPYRMLVMENIILYSFLIAVFSVTYRCLLAHEAILSWWFQFGARFHDKWYYKPIWGCELCFSGQVVLWTYFINWVAHSGYFNLKAPFWRLIYFLIPEYHIEQYSVLNGLIFILMTIMFTLFISKLYHYVKNNI